MANTTNLFSFKLLLFPIWIFSITVSAQTTVGNIQHTSGLRSYRIHLPSGYQSTQTYPLVFNFHGYTSNAWQQEFYSGMSQIADDEQFIVVYPEGIGNSWNVGFSFQSYTSGVDDVGFTNALIDTLIMLYSIDTTRIYSCGMSNGGYLSYRLACELSHRITAIASVTGLMTDSMAYFCSPMRDVPIMQVHGTADPVVNYNGIPSSLSVEETLLFWVNNNDCQSSYSLNPVPDNNVLDLCTADFITYHGCNDCAPLIFYRINGGGHTWPGATIDNPTVGLTNRDFNASAEIWNFFIQHQMGCYVSIEQNQLPVVQIYPNPTTSFLQIHNLPNDVQYISIFDIHGHMITALLNNEILDVSMLHNGIYLLSIHHAKGIEYTRFIKISD
ncbi:MAG: T9SS type A sorting domain-containing protein [Candidatus Competibacteraceae bacterium]|nr:T9SS type A sorting domain-containing protein [Candidatus Competibacteraceae bacterium]